ncbi:WD40 repeat-like protein, partial [Periconia macrospinosa]
VAFSPEGKQLASTLYDRTVKLWDAGTGAVLQTLEGYSGAVWAVAFSPDGKVLASGSDDETVKLWDAGTGAGSFTTYRSPSDALSRPSPSYGIFIKEQWVCYGLEGRLWLPPGYRPHCTNVYGSAVALGYSSSRVLINDYL